MGLLEPGKGNGAVLDRPIPKDQVSDWKDNLRKAGRTVSVSIKEVVEISGHKIEGETEPRYDGAYDRAAIRLRREGDDIVNANEFSFRCSLDWPGPLVAFVAHDSEGKAIAKAPTNKFHVKAGMEITVGEGKAKFIRIEREKD